MEKWKIAAIMALLFGLGGYGWYSSNAGTTPAPTPEVAPTAAPDAQAPQSTPALPQYKGKPLIAWDIPAGLWMNTDKPITVADLKGNVTLIEFFRIGCNHCEAAAPFMEQTYKKYAPRGLKMVAFHSPGRDRPEERDWLTVKNKIREWGVTYPVAFDEQARLFAQEYRFRTFPSVMVVDKEGIIRYFKAGHTAESAKVLTAFLEKTLKK